MGLTDPFGAPSPAIGLGAPLIDTLTAVAALLADAREPWWIIASAAAALHSAAPIVVSDVDVLIGIEDAQRTLPALGLALEPGAASDRFRSDIFAIWHGCALPVEFMAGFHRRDEIGWHPVRPASRQPFDLGACTIHVPDRAELIGMFRSFGRPKDLERVRLLENSR